ncbi:MAG: hypothetical protein HKN31_04200 [Pricia sp.]|nr:hypothetical protein [Pricia sp.]
MKKLSLLLMIFLFSQMTQAQNNEGSYEILWKRVQKLESEALTKSALQVVDSISAKAKKEKNSAQTIKALLYSSKYAMTLEEDAQLQIINDFKAEIEKAEVPTRNVLQSYLANLYWQYFQQNRHRFYDRTKTESKIDSTDFRTWDLTTIFEEINLHFQASLENKNKLQEADINDFKEIIDQQPDSEVYRPTLFDILAHTALQFYKTDENSITRPSDKFEIDNPEILCEAYEFTQQPIQTEDATSLQSKALIIYQELVQFHFPNPKLDALVDVDIDRLNYIHQNAIFPDKDEIFIEVLENSAENIKQHEVSALYRYEIARLFHTQGTTYDPKTNAENRWKQKEALELCETFISQFPDSKGAEKCKALKSEILAPSMQLTVESHIPVNSPSRVLIDFKNFEQLQLRAYEVEQDQRKQLNNLYPEAKQLAFIQRLPMVKEWQTQLKNENDYQHHSTELLVPPMENGQYILLAIPLDSNGKKVASGTFAFSALQVTDMALVETRTPTHYNYQVIDRQNGEPMSEAELKFTYLKNYNKPYLNKTLVSDKLGRVSIPLTDENWADISVVVSHDNQKAYFGE